MNQSNFVICEKTGKWAAAIRRVCGLASDVCETRSWPACLRELRTRTAAMVAVEVLPENAEVVCRRLAELAWRSRHVHALLLADRSLRDLEWLLREAGAVHVLFSPRELVRVRPIWERFRMRMPPSRSTFREHVWSRLPWTKQETEAGASERLG
jgi:hypothetical protein